MLNLRLNSRRDSAALVRAVFGGMATPFALRAELLNDLKTVVSEACNNAVNHAYRGETGAIAVRVAVQLENIEVTVRDWGGGFPQVVAPAGDRLRVGLPLINALADRAEFLTAPGSGTEVRMGFDLRHDPRRTDTLVRLGDAEDVEASLPWRRGFCGDVVVTSLAHLLLPNVLGALTSALAARSRFSLERFSDVYIVTRAVGKHVRTAARGSRVSFSLTARDRRLELTIGPLGIGSGERLHAIDPDADSDQSWAALVDEIAFEQVAHSELLRVALIDRERDLSGTSGRR